MIAYICVISLPRYTLLLGSRYPQDYIPQASPLAFKWWVMFSPMKHKQKWYVSLPVQLWHSSFSFPFHSEHSDSRNHMGKVLDTWFTACRKAACSQQCPYWTLQVWEIKFYSVWSITYLMLGLFVTAATIILTNMLPISKLEKKPTHLTKSSLLTHKMSKLQKHQVNAYSNVFLLT